MQQKHFVHAVGGVVLTSCPMLLQLDLMNHQGASTGSIPVSIRM